MSLLLEALKKAEREKEEKAKTMDAAETPSSAAPPAPAMAQVEAVAPAAPAPAVTPAASAPAAQAAAPTAAAAPVAAMAPVGAAGFTLKAGGPTKAAAPQLPDEPAKAADAASRLKGAAQAKTVRKRVTAGRIFQARAEDGAPRRRSRPGLALAAVLVLALVGAGAYYQFIGLPQSGVPQLAKAPPKIPQVQVDEAEAEELLPLSSPIVDIQSELLDYAALQIPEGENAQDEIARRLAVLTGEAPSLDALTTSVPDVEPVLDLVAESPENDEDAFDPTDAPLISALDSRLEKSRLDAQGAVDINIVRSSEADEAPAQETAVATAVVAAAEATDDEAMAERHALLKRAQSDYRAGKLVEAEALFRRVLHEDETNLDALRGLAQTVAAGGRYQLAASIYLQILEHYPKDPVAIAELVNLQARQANPELSEQRLKGLLGAEPAADARVYFALGNLYAAGGRWLEAQSAYFEAVARDSANPDYAYNLAVTLDYLNKRAIALQYYREALALTDGGAPSGFDPAAARVRIAELE